jgi:aminodeoxyfutalosine synthase
MVLAPESLVQTPSMGQAMAADAAELALEPMVSHYISSPSNPLSPIFAKVLAGERITRDEAITVYQSDDLLSIGILADTARKLRTPQAVRDHVYWVHNYHINPTNICEANCRFCSYKKGPKSPNAYQMSVDDVIAEVNAYPDHAKLSEFHIVSGLWRGQGLAYYTDLFKALKQHFSHVHIKGLTAVEIAYIAQIEGVSEAYVLQTLKNAGLGSLPGGGAEVFAERIRQAVCPDKLKAEDWLRIHGMAHAMGMRSNATMLAGLGETIEERIDHMLAIRDQQDQSQGFMTFIPLNCYYENNAVGSENALTGIENLKNFAVSRLVLDNVGPHQSVLDSHWRQAVASQPEFWRR